MRVSIRPLQILFLYLVMVITLAQHSHALEPPPLKGRINDYAGMLNLATAQALERSLAAFEQQTTTQVVLLTVPTLAGDTIESFAISVGDAWKIGQKDKGNGVMLILAKKERKIRIEVGTGLQGALPDITASQIIRNVIGPHLRAGDFDKGISSGLTAIMDAIKGEFKAPPNSRPTAKKQQSRFNSLFLWLGGALLVSLLAAAASRRSAAIAGGVSLPLAVDMSLGVGYGTLVMLGIAGVIIGLVLNMLLRLFRSGGGGGFHGGGGWGGPTIFYGGGGGSSGSDDSFSGGGGDFDGGGSSDEW